MDALSLLIALLPIVSSFLLLILLRMPAKTAMPLVLLLTVILSGFVWRVPFLYIAASAVEGLFAAASILWIVFGALLLLKTLSHSGALHRIQAGFNRISPDRRVQVILVAWFFGAFIEGIAGFGTPAALGAPLLIALGFPALAAVVLTLIANSVPVSFGAVGTPVVIGMDQGLRVAGQPAPMVEGWTDGLPLDLYVQSVAVQAVTIDILIGSLVPLLLCGILTRFFGQNRSWREGLSLWKFALFAGVLFELPALAVAAFIGPEFPSIIGGIMGLGIATLAARRGFLLPRKHWDDFAVEKIKPDFVMGQSAPPRDIKMKLAVAWMPYLLVTVLLIATRLPFLPLRSFLSGYAISWTDIFGTGVQASLALLYLPGSVFLLVVLMSIWAFRLNGKAVRSVFAETTTAIKPAAIALCAAVPMVRIFVNTDMNALGFDSMPLVLAGGAAEMTGAGWPLFAPMVGALGSFLAGSATFSNMMFSLLQFSAALQVEVLPRIMLAAQMLGANAGNMISIANIIAVASITGLSGREGLILRYTIGPMLAYVLLVGFNCLIWTMVLG